MWMHANLYYQFALFFIKVLLYHENIGTTFLFSFVVHFDFVIIITKIFLIWDLCLCLNLNIFVKQQRTIEIAYTYLWRYIIQTHAHGTMCFIILNHVTERKANNSNEIKIFIYKWNFVWIRLKNYITVGAGFSIGCNPPTRNW